MDVCYHIANLCHVIALTILFYKIIKTKSSVGLSGKSQILFALVYTTRYANIFYNNISQFDSLLKLFFIIGSYIIIFLIYISYMENNDCKNDTFMSELLVTPAFIMALFFNYYFRAAEIIWAFSIYLETVAIIPQFYLIYKKKEVEKLVIGYLIAIGLYRAFYIPHWIYNYNWQGNFDIIADAAGVVYTAIFLLAVLVLVCNKEIHIADSCNEQRYLIRNIFLISNNEMSNDTLSLMQHSPLPEKDDPMTAYESPRQEREDPMKMVYEPPRQVKEDAKKMIHESPKQEKQDPVYNETIHVV